MPIDAKDLITESVELASLPSVVMTAMDLVNNPNASASDIGEVISQDPALTIKLLKIVNSAFYGFPSRIDTISRAITIVGTLELTDLILGSSAIQMFSRLPNQLVNMRQFWEHSLYTAVVARILARYLRAPNTERCFVMGLLHDVGSLILFRQKPDESRQALELASNNVPLHIAEREVFGFDHGAVGAELMRSWNLPDSFVTATRHHHQPSAAESHRLETAIIHLADAITGMVHSTATGTRNSPLLEPGAWELTGLSVDIVEAVSTEADVHFGEACAAILPRNQAA